MIHTKPNGNNRQWLLHKQAIIVFKTQFIKMKKFEKLNTQKFENLEQRSMGLIKGGKVYVSPTTMITGFNEDYLTD